MLAGNRLITSNLDPQVKTQALIELLDELITDSAASLSPGLCLCLVEFDNILHVIPATQVYT